MDWHLAPGDSIRRVDLHARYGGRRQGGIGPSAVTPNVFVFSDPVQGRLHGYIDAWREDGLFHYTGEGQRGDQQLLQGNLAILEHRKDGRALRVFDGVGGHVTYRGRFEVAEDKPYYRTDAPETGGQVIRQVIVFRLRPIDAKQEPPSSPLDDLPSSTVTEVAIEQQNTERTFVDPGREGYESERREQKLVIAYRDFMAARGVLIVRHLIRPTGEVKPIFTDAYAPQANLLIEAKGTGTREAIRMAIGQLADYSRFIEPAPRKALLLPSRPRVDLEQLLSFQGIAVIWQSSTQGFVDNVNGKFTAG